MTNPAAFRATYSDWKLIKTRQCVQIIFEVPLADADQAYDVLGGMPDAAKERWFGIAPLRSDAPAEAPTAPEEPELTSVTVKSTTPWRDLTPTVQSVLRCDQPAFQAFLREEYRTKIDNEKDAATEVRKICGVNSRSTLSTNHAARMIWHALDSKFQAWQRVGA